MLTPDHAFHRLFRHGGDLPSAAIAFPEAPRPWIDLSTGINPVPYPLPPIPDEAWARLPHPSELDALRDAAAARYGCASENVVVGPGTEALIQLAPRLFPAARIKILKPTYSGHETAWRASGAAIESADEISQLHGASHGVVVNPNNPDGRRAAEPELRALAEIYAQRRGLLIVDEAFADFDPAGLAANPPPATIVFRSFGKTFGLAGVRLGFAIAEPSIAARLRESVGEWPISGPAIVIGRKALADDAWLAGARARLAADAAALDARLFTAGFELMGGTLLFRLARSDHAPRAFRRLGEQGVLTRPFAEARDRLRFGLPRPQDQERVFSALWSI